MTVQFQSIVYNQYFSAYNFRISLYRKMKIRRTNKSNVNQQNVPQKIVNHLQPKTDLKNIIELTEQYDANPSVQQETHHVQTPKTDKTQFKVTKRIKSYINCIKNLYKYICFTPDSLELDIKDNQFATTITNIKNKKKHYNVVIPSQKQQKKVLVLDLDQTLIHTTFNKPQKYDFQSQVMFNGRTTKIYTSKRFGLQAFLFEMSKLYEIIVFTASQKLYADKIIDLIDPKRRISHRLYRQNCIVVNKSYYLKNLNILGRNLKEIVIVDDNNIAGILQPDNFYRIEPFQGNEKDRQLCRLSAFLKHIHPKTSILPIRLQRKQFEQMEINLQQEVISQVRANMMQRRTLNERKKQYRHKKSSSQVQALVVNIQAETEAQTTASDLIKKL